MVFLVLLGSLHKLRLHFLAFDHVRTHFLCSKFSLFLTTYPPLNANVTCEGSLIGKLKRSKLWIDFLANQHKKFGITRAGKSIACSKISIFLISLLKKSFCSKRSMHSQFFATIFLVFSWSDLSSPIKV